MNTLKEVDILDRSKIALHSLFGNTISIKDDSFERELIDGVLRINTTKLSFSIIKNPTNLKILKELELFKSSSRSSGNLLLILDYANQELSKLLKEKNIFFVDTAGNCYINLPGLYVLVEGRKNVLQEARAKKRRAFQKTGLKLIFELLMHPELANETYRVISNQTNVSLASVGYIIDELKNDGFLLEINQNRKHLSSVKRLITKWAMSYAELLRPTISRGFFRAIDNTILDHKLVRQNIENDLLFGGEYGCYYLNRSIKPTRPIIYTNIRLGKLAQKYQIIPLSTSNKNEQKIEILERFWRDEYPKDASSKNGESLNYNIVDPILIYADLIMSNDYRSIHAAEEILNNEIRNKFIRYNFQW